MDSLIAWMDAAVQVLVTKVLFFRVSRSTVGHRIFDTCRLALVRSLCRKCLWILQIMTQDRHSSEGASRRSKFVCGHENLNYRTLTAQSSTAYTMTDRRGCCTSRKDSTKLHGFAVTYNSGSHLQVLTQCWGSVWSRVLPYCLFNVALSVVLQCIQGYNGFDFRITDKGHTYLTMLVSFLVVSRATVSSARYNQMRNHLKQIFCMQRQFIHQTTIMSSSNINQSGKEWRHDVSYLSLLHLRSIMAAIDYQCDGIPAWEMPEFDGKIAASLKKELFLEESTRHFAHHTTVSEYEENMRVPIRLALKLRQAVIAQRKSLDHPFVWAEEAQLLGTIDKLMNGYYG